MVCTNSRFQARIRVHVAHPYLWQVTQGKPYKDLTVILVTKI